MVQMQTRCPDRGGATDQKAVIDEAEVLDLGAQVAAEMNLLFEDQGCEKKSQILKAWS